MNPQQTFLNGLDRSMLTFPEDGKAPIAHLQGQRLAASARALGHHGIWQALQGIGPDQTVPATTGQARRMAVALALKLNRRITWRDHIPQGSTMLTSREGIDPQASAFLEDQGVAIKERIAGIKVSGGFDQGYAFGHEIAWYGVSAVAHAYLLAQARTLVPSIGADAFAERFHVKNEQENPYTHPRLRIPLQTLSEAGIYIPPQIPPLLRERGIFLFSRDYKNRTGDAAPWRAPFNEIAATQAFAMMSYPWTVDDLAHPEFNANGTIFAKLMFEGCVLSYKNLAPGCGNDIPPVDQEDNEAAQMLIRYYSALIDALT